MQPRLFPNAVTVELHRDSYDTNIEVQVFSHFVELMLVPMIYTNDVLQIAASLFGLQPHRVFGIFRAGYFAVKKHPHHDARFAWVSQPKRSCRHLLLDHLNLNGGCHDVLLDGD